MKKKHKKHWKHRNAGAATTSAPRVSRPRAKANTDEETSLKRLGYTAAGAAGTALLGSFLAREGWAPKTIAGALTAVGAGLAWRGDASTVRSLGAGAMSAAGSQLALMVIDDRDKPRETTTAKPKNADDLPPGAVENAFERARERLSLSASEMD